MKASHVRSASVVGILALAAVIATASPASAEVFLDLYAGGAFFGKPDFTIETNNGASRETERGESDTEVTGGGRAGYWFDLQGLPWLGVALDVSYFEPQFTPKGGDGNLVKVKVRTVPISPLLMLRLPLLQSPPHPNGQLQIYVGVGPGLFWTETTTRFLNGVTEKVSADTIEVGVDFRGGVSFEIVPNVALFAEYRFTHYSISPEGRINGQRAKVEADLDTNHVLGGISFRFH
jgi:opacity protein-like surface antigen